MRSWLANLRKLELPYGAKYPTEPALVLGPDLPTELQLQYPQFKAAIIGYVGGYNPLLNTPQVKYHFIGLYVDSTYNATSHGYVLDLDATNPNQSTKKVISTISEGTDSADPTKPNRSALALGPNGLIGTADDYIQLLGATYVNQTLSIVNAGDDLNGWRGWKAINSFSNGWQNFAGFDALAVRRHVTGMVSIRGVLQASATKAHNTVLATLPADAKGRQAWAPKYNQIFPVRSDNATGQCAVYAETGTGVLYLQTTGTAFTAPGAFIWINHSWPAE